MYYCYILYSKTINQTYVGYTNDLKRRLSQHGKDNTATTKRTNDYKIIWYSAFINKKEAKLFEKYLKSGSGRAFFKRHLFSA